MSIIKRRAFLKQAGTGAAAMNATIAGKAFAEGSPNDTLNVAVMGVRNRGTAHARGFQSISNVRVATICDADLNMTQKAVDAVVEAGGEAPKVEQDIRRVIDDDDIDIISIAAPNYWHALATVWACQAGKDVYVEKPVSYCIDEGRKMVNAARKYERIVQTGSQNRSNKAVQAAMTFLHEGRLGEIYMAKAVVYRPREPFGLSQPAEIPEGVDYGLWLGPTEWYDFDKNRFHYNWHWFWNTGNGETGNNGVHYTDLLRWGCQRDDHPYKIQSMGGYYLFEDECIQETPNTQMSVMQYDDGLEFQVEVRNWHTHLDGDVQMGVHFYGSEGWLSLIPHGNSWTTHFGFHHDGRPGPEMRIEPPEGVDPHFLNFIDAVRSRNHEDLNADIEDGHKAATLCHLCNIAYRVGRTVMFDSATETFPDDYIAQDLVSREYREPFVMPDEI